MPAPPKLHNRHILPGLLRADLPIPLQRGTDLRLQPGARQHGLGLIGTHDGSTDGGAEDGLGVVEEEDVGGLAQGDAEGEADERPEGSQVAGWSEGVGVLESGGGRRGGFEGGGEGG